MKRSYRLITIALLTAFGLTNTGCKDYLQEELVSTLTNDYYKTEKGLEDLVRAAYEPTRFKYANEHSYAMFNFGTDEFTHADQVNYIYWNTYERNRLNTGNGIESFVHDVWTADYDGINRCNIGIDKIPAFTGGTTTLSTPAQKAQRLGELHFLRAYYYFQLVQQYGAIPITLKPTESVQLEYERAPVPQVYQQIIKDLRFAAENLSPTTTEFGRATRGAAQHYLAKVYLTRGSAITDERGQKPTDIDSAAYYADQVITSGRYVLENDFARLWDISSYANNRAAQTSREIIFSTQFNNVITLAGRFGNRVHSYFTMIYEDTPGMARDLLNDRPFRRLMPTNYTMDIYDRRNDSRFYKSFKTVWIANNAATIPRWTAANAPTPAQIGQHKFALGDTAIFIRVNTPQTTLTAAQIARTRYATFARYFRNANGSLGSAFDPTGPVGVRNKYPQLLKYIDPFRAGSGVNEEAGTRDGILARFAETYLIAAEAYGRKGDYAKALSYINILRNRAAYKAGEAKPTAFSLVEGGTRGDVASTAAALQVTMAKFTTNDPAEMYPPSATTQQDRFIAFILNERTRELAGELHRWEDLARTETLVERARTFNPDTRAEIQPYHKLRPIPREHLERIFRAGQALSPEERQAEQNPGY
jgi:hypothetical protein